MRASKSRPRCGLMTFRSIPASTRTASWCSRSSAPPSSNAGAGRCHDRRGASARARSKGRGAARARRRLRRACAARRLYRPDLRHAADLAGASSASAMPRSALMQTVFSGTLAGFQIPVGLAGRAVRRAARARARHRARRARLSASPASAAGFALLVAALFVGGLGASTQHPLALVADRACFRRRALAHGARHLQFRRRHRQDDAAGGGVAAVRACCPGGEALALLGGIGAAGGGRDLRADAALRAAEAAAAAQERRRPRPAARGCAHAAFRCCCRSA